VGEALGFAEAGDSAEDIATGNRKPVKTGAFPVGGGADAFLAEPVVTPEDSL